MNSFSSCILPSASSKPCFSCVTDWSRRAGCSSSGNFTNSCEMKTKCFDGPVDVHNFGRGAEILAHTGTDLDQRLHEDRINVMQKEN